VLADSHIDIHNQILRVAVAIPGMPFSLHYSSDRVLGRRAAYILEIPLSEKKIPAGLKEIKLEISVAGQRFTKGFPPLPEQSYTFAWDGKDGSGQPIPGKQEAQIRIGYLYKASFPRPEITRWKEWTSALGAQGTSALGFAGWSLSVHHAYDPVESVLYFGDGTTVDRQNTRHDADRGQDDEIILAAEDASEVYVFDRHGRHLRTIDPLIIGVLYRFKYDDPERLLEIEDIDGNITRFEHQMTETFSEVIGPYGRRATLKKDGNSSLASITNAAGDSVRFAYSKDGLLESLSDGNGNIYRFTYDESGRLIRQQDPTGAVTGLASKRDNEGALIALISPSGRESTYLVEDLPTGEERRVNRCCGGGEIIELRRDDTRTISYPDGSVVELAEQPDPRFGMQAPLSKSLRIAMPGKLNFTVTMDRTTTFHQNSPQTLATLTDTVKINGRAYTTVYDAATRTFTHTTPLGKQSMATADSLGRIVHVQVGGLLPVNLEYDKRGRLLSVAQGRGGDERRLLFGYNSQGQIESITDALQQTLRATYDDAGRVIMQVLLDGRTINFNYDACGNLVSVIPPERPAHVYSYSAVNLPLAYSPPNQGDAGNQTLYTYNLDRQLSSFTGPDGKCVTLTYDNAGGLNKLRFSRGEVIYGFDATTGNLLSITAPGGIALLYAYDGSLLTNIKLRGPINAEMTRAYDDNLRVTEIKLNGSAINLSYDDDGLATRVGDLRLIRNRDTGLLGGTKLGEITDTFRYDGFGEVASYSAAFKDTVIFASEYSRDKLGRLIEKRETIDGTYESLVYIYDAAGRLAEVRKNGATTASYTYDGHGNRLRGPSDLVTYTYDVQDRLLERNSREESQKYAYTDNGELRAKTAGNATTIYEYDELGNLREITMPDGTRIEYTIDGLNRRIGRKINGVLVQSFLYQDNLTPVAELDGHDTLVSRFVYASRPNVPDYLIRGGVTYRIISDHLGTPRLVVNVITGAIAQRLDYDEFGNIISVSHPGFQPFGFAGGLHDSATGLLRFGVRDYAASVGRWTAKDPILFAGKDSNLYVYALNDPVNLIDLDGRDPTAILDYTKDLCEGYKEKLAKQQGQMNKLQAQLKEVELKLKACLTPRDRKIFKRWQRNLSHQIQVLDKVMEGEQTIVSSMPCKNFETAYAPVNQAWEDWMNQARKAWEDLHKWADMRKIIKFPY
jgi:RHS repeat-associated protein